MRYDTPFTRKRNIMPERIADEAVSLLTDESRASAMRADIADVRAKLGGPGASDRAAAAILSVAERGAAR